MRVLLSIDTAKTDMKQTPSLGKVERADNDYALAWVRQYGRGRVFYCGFAHHPSVFWDPKMLQFYLAATQFALGDLPAPTTPSAKLTPAVRAQEQLGWRLALVPSAKPLMLFETIDKAAELGLLYVGGSNRQRVSRDIPKGLDGQLNNDEMRQIRLKLDAAGIRLLTYRIDDKSSDKVFEFAEKMGVEAVTTPAGGRIMDPAPEIVPLDKNVGSLLDRVHKSGRGPVVFTIESGSDELPQRVELFNKATVELAKGGRS